MANWICGDISIWTDYYFRDLYLVSARLTHMVSVVSGPRQVLKSPFVFAFNHHHHHANPLCPSLDFSLYVVRSYFDTFLSNLTVLTAASLLPP